MANIPQPDIEAPLAPEPKMVRTINWGGVIKGAAIVTAAVLVGYAVYALAWPAITGYLATATTPGATPAFGASVANSIISGTGTLLSGTGDLIATAADKIWVFAKGITTSIGGLIQGTDAYKAVSEAAAATFTTPAVSTDAISKGIALTGAGAAGLVTLGATKALVGAPHLTHMVPDMHDVATLAKAGHAATHEHAAKAGGKWTDMHQSRAAHASWTDHADASKAMGPKTVA